MSEQDYPNECPIEGCEWNVPTGMNYLWSEHADEHRSRLPMVYYDLKRWLSWKWLRFWLWVDDRR